jgi:hypothetical protein
MILTGCFALAVATMQACYSTDAGGVAKLSCSDMVIEGTPTCEEYRKQLGFNPNTPKSTNSVILTFPVK